MSRKLGEPIIPTTARVHSGDRTFAVLSTPVATIGDGKPKTALPERYRKFTSIKEGYEVRLADGTWVEVVNTLHITAPLNFVRLDFADGTGTAGGPRDEVMSRRHVEASADTRGEDAGHAEGSK